MSYTARIILREIFWLSCLMWGILFMVSATTEGIPYTSIHIRGRLMEDAVGGLGLVLTVVGIYAGFSIGHASRRQRDRWQESSKHPAERVLATLLRLRHLPGNTAMAELQALYNELTSNNYDPDASLAIARVGRRLDEVQPDDRDIDQAWDEAIGKTRSWLKRAAS
jgi:hypothetical protein